MDAAEAHLSNSLMRSFEKGSLQKKMQQISAKFRKLSPEFQHPFLTQSNVFFKFPQTFRKNPFANDPISELQKFIKQLEQGKCCRRACDTFWGSSPSYRPLSLDLTNIDAISKTPLPNGCNSIGLAEHGLH